MNKHKTPIKVPVSVKGIVFEGEKIWLRKNERNEWELPGGKVDQGEKLEEAVQRELQEELGFLVDVQGIVHAHLYKIKESVDESKGVLVLSYLCRVVEKMGEMEKESEGGRAEFQVFTPKEVDSLVMEKFYKEAIRKAKGV